MRVNPDGKVPCDLAIFGEAPGFEEQIEGRGFVGKSGQQLWTDMRRYTGLERKDWYVSNLVKEGKPKNQAPKPHEIAAAMPEFLDELERVQPRIVVTAGGFSTRAMLGDVSMADVHGIPHVAEVAGHTYTVLPCYHPAAGLHNKGFLAAFAYDLKRLDARLRGDLPQWAPGPPVRSEWLTKHPDKDFVRSATVISLDTEGWADKPWGLSFSLDGKTGYVIRANDPLRLTWFANRIAGRVVVMHNGLHDRPVLRAMGIDLTGCTVHDTMVLAYHDMMRTGSGVLEAESQNLGTLAYRECGMKLGSLSRLIGVDLASREIPYTDEVRDYAGADAIATWRLFDVYRQRRYQSVTGGWPNLIDSEAYQIDMGQVPLVEAMIAHGIPFDADGAMTYYTEVIDKFDAVTGELRTMAARMGNRDFNPGSHPQVRELLTRKIGLRIRKRTKGGLASTNEKALADHAEHPFVKKLQDYRELSKLIGTYLEPLLEELSCS